MCRDAGKAAPAKKKPAKRPRKRKITFEDLKVCLLQGGLRLLLKKSGTA